MCLKGHIFVGTSSVCCSGFLYGRWRRNGRRFRGHGRCFARSRICGCCRDRDGRYGTGRRGRINKSTRICAWRCWCCFFGFATLLGMRRNLFHGSAKLESLYFGGPGCFGCSLGRLGLAGIVERRRRGQFGPCRCTRQGHTRQNAHQFRSQWGVHSFPVTYLKGSIQIEAVCAPPGTGAPDGVLRCAGILPARMSSAQNSWCSLAQVSST